MTSLLKVHELIQGITQDNQVESVICKIMFKSVTPLSQKQYLVFYFTSYVFVFVLYIYKITFLPCSSPAPCSPKMWNSHSKNAIYRDMSSTYICKYTINTSTRDNKFSHWKQKQYQFCHIYQINHTWMLLTVSTLTTLTTRPHRSGSIVTTRLSTLSTRNASTLDKMTLPSGFFMATNNNHNNYRHGHFVLGFIYIC